MARWRVAGTALAAALVALLFAVRVGSQTSQDQLPDESSWESRSADARAALLAAGDADSLEAAALLAPKMDPVERLQLVLRAAAAAPARPDLAWLALASCIPVASCDVTPLEARLRAVDPGNGAAWMGSLARAAAGTSQFKASLAGISGSERFDIYWNLLIVHTADAIKRTKTMEAHEAVVLASGLGSAQAIPALQPIGRGCKDVAVIPPEDLSGCRRLTGALRHGDSFIIEGYGLALARLLWPASSPEYRQAAEQRRVLDYRLRRQAEWSLDVVSDAGMNRYLERLAAHRTEEEALVAELVARGVSPNPPAGWVDHAL